MNPLASSGRGEKVDSGREEEEEEAVAILGEGKEGEGNGWTSSASKFRAPPFASFCASVRSKKVLFVFDWSWTM